MIGYTTFGSNDVARARAFYDELLGLLGAKRIMEFPDEMGGFTMWGTGFDKPGLAVTTPYDKNAANVGNGVMVALTVDSRAKVSELHAKALALGGADEGAVGLRGEEGPTAFFAGYFRDLDGNKLCVFCMGPA